MKKVYPNQIPGCDPNFAKNPYGDEKCFEYLTDAFENSGRQIIAGTKEYRSNDKCELTTQEYFDGKIK